MAQLSGKAVQKEVRRNRRQEESGRQQQGKNEDIDRGEDGRRAAPLPPPFQLGALQQVVHARPDREKGLPANREALLKALAAMVRQHPKP